MISMCCASLKHIKFRWCFQWQVFFTFCLLLCDFATVLDPHLVCGLKQILLRTVDTYTFFLNLGDHLILWIFFFLDTLNLNNVSFSPHRHVPEQGGMTADISFLLCLISCWKQGPELNRNIATRCWIICDFMLWVQDLPKQWQESVIFLV